MRAVFSTDKKKGKSLYFQISIFPILELLLQILLYVLYAPLRLQSIYQKIS